jgi:hypothetical protein
MKTPILFSDWRFAVQAEKTYICLNRPANRQGTSSVLLSTEFAWPAMRGRHFTN